MKAYRIVAYIFILLYCLGCTQMSLQKLPVPKENTGVLIIPTQARNQTQFPFGYYYSFVYTPKTDVDLDIHPMENKNFRIFTDFPAGEYHLEGIRALSAPTFQVQTFSLPKTVKAIVPLRFKIEPMTITLLDFSLMIEQEGRNVTGNYFSQSSQIKPLNKGELDELRSAIGLLPNFELWSFQDTVHTGEIQNRLIHRSKVTPRLKVD